MASSIKTPNTDVKSREAAHTPQKSADVGAATPPADPPAAAKPAGAPPAPVPLAVKRRRARAAAAAAAAAAAEAEDAKPVPPPAPDARPVRPVAGPARRRGRHVWLVFSFLLFVCLPSAGVGVYLWTTAVDQYSSRVGFSVRREETSSAFDFLGGLTSLSGSSSNDTDILFEFIQSQKLVMDINEELDLQEKWSRPSQDAIFALPEEASVEQLVTYWNRMVRISYGAGSGLIEVEVLAFDPNDAHAIATAVLERSSEMINQLSDIARQDSIGYARDELDSALDRLKDARATVTLFRNENQVVDPELDLRSQAGLLAMLQTQQAEALIELDVLRTAISRESDPRLEQAELRLRVIEERIAAERQELGFGAQNGDGSAFADLVGEYERLVVDREFSEQAYVSALASYDSALAESRRKSRYLAAYMQPTLAETAQYPKRFTLFAVVSMFVFLLWSILVLVSYSIKDRR